MTGTLGMGLTFWAGKEPGTTHEASVRSRVISAFERTFGAESEPLFVVFDVSLSAMDLDMLILKTNAVIAIEIKECGDPIRGTENGSWLIMEGPQPWKELKGGHHGNPFQQVKQYRYELMRYLKKKSSLFLSQQKAEQIRFDHVSAMVCLSPERHPRSEIDKDLEKKLRWFYIDGIDRLGDRVRQIRSAQMSFTGRELERLVRDVLHCDLLQPVAAPATSAPAPVAPPERNGTATGRAREILSTLPSEVVEDFRSDGLLEEHWITCTPALDAEVALVLDTSESAAGVWDGIWAWASQLKNQIAAGIRLRVFFLGNPQEFTFAALNARIAVEVGRNRARVSLIGPVYKQLSSRPNLRVLLAGCGRIHDLECWTKHPLFARTRFLRFGADSLTSGLAPEMQNAEDAIRELQMQVTRVELAGRGLMPHWWDNPGYSWDPTNEALVAKTTTGYEIKAALLAPPGEPFRITAYFGNEESSELGSQQLTPQAPDWREPASPSDHSVLREVLSSGEYSCPLCARKHPASDVRCYDSGRPTVGDIVHHGARAVDCESPLRAFVILDRLGRWHLHSCNVLRVGAGKVALAAWPPNRRATVDILRFETEREQWIVDANERWRQYWPLPGGTYAILP